MVEDAFRLQSGGPEQGGGGEVRPAVSQGKSWWNWFSSRYYPTIVSPALATPTPTHQRTPSNGGVPSSWMVRQAHRMNLLVFGLVSWNVRGAGAV